MSHGNYRVVCYADDGHLGSAHDSRNCLRRNNYDDLKGSVELIREAFDQPLLRVVDDRLAEVTSG